MQPKQTISQQFGFSLLELMVSVSILAITATFAVPSMSKWYLTSGVDSAADQLVGMVNMARSESFRRGTALTLCGADVSSGGVLAANGCSVSGSWNNGILLFDDIDGNQSYSGAADKVKLIAFASELQITTLATKITFDNLSNTGSNQAFCIGRVLSFGNYYSVQVMVSNFGASISCRKDDNANCNGC